jgi:hypothetical protein
MFNILANLIDGPAGMKLAGPCMDEIIRHFLCRAAVTSLRELDDGLLRDIGLVRCKVGPIVFINRSDRGRM